MQSFTLFASPWWVNLLVLVPIVLFFACRKDRLSFTRRDLVATAIFGIAFGFVEAAVVVYLRTILGFIPVSSDQLVQVTNVLPQNLFAVEFVREIATIVMLGSIGALVGRGFKERFAIFLWAFAFWDIFYYIWLLYLVKWPSSLMTSDVLFLVPVPWLSQVWFPILVSLLSIFAVVLSVKNDRK
jgi:hypothetical protein